MSIFLDPQSNVNSEWLTYDYTNIDDGARWPSGVPDDSVYCLADGKPDSNVVQNWGMGNLDTDTATLSGFQLYIDFQEAGNILAPRSGILTAGAYSHTFNTQSLPFSSGWGIYTSPQAPDGITINDSVTFGLLTPTLNNSQSVIVNKLYLSFETFEPTGLSNVERPFELGLCDQFIVPDKNRPSFFSSGNIDESLINYSGVPNTRNSNNLSYYTPSGDLSFASYICSGNSSPEYADDSTYIVIPTGTIGRTVCYFMWQGDPLLIEPSEAYLYIKASGGNVGPFYSTFSLGDYNNQISNRQSINVVGDDPEDGSVVISNSGAQNGFEQGGHGLINQEFNWLWSQQSRDAGHTIHINPILAGEAFYSGVYHGDRTEIRGYFTIDASGIETFAISEMGVLFQGDCVNEYELCSLNIGGNENINEESDLFIEGYSPINDSVDLYISGFPGSRENITLYTGNTPATGEAVNLFLGQSGEIALNNTLYLEAQLGTIDENLDLYISNFESPSGSLNLHIPGTGNFTFDDPAYSLNLFIKNDSSIHSGVGLYTYSAETLIYSGGPGGLNLLIKNSIENSGDMNLYIYGSGFGSYYGNTQLYISGSAPSDNLTLFINSQTANNSDKNLFISSYFEESGNLNLFLGGDGGTEIISRPLYVGGGAVVTETTPLFIGSSEQSGVLNLFLKTIEFIPSGATSAPMSIFSTDDDVVFNSTFLFAFNGNEEALNLFVKGPDNVLLTSSMNLFIDGELPGFLPNLLEMVVYSDVFATGELSLFMPDPVSIDYSGNMNLFINRETESAAFNSPLYLQTAILNNNDTDLFIDGANHLNDNITMFISGVGEPYESRRLYIHGY